MTASLIPTPVMQFFDSNGDPLVGGKVYTYAAGTSTPLATYTDQGGATPNANPVILDSRGEAAIWFGGSSYKLVLKTSADVLIWTADNVTAALASLAASSGSSLVGFLPAGTGAVATTAQAKMRERVSAVDGGADITGATDSSTSIQNRVTLLASGGKLELNTGTLKVSNQTATTPGVWIPYSEFTLSGNGAASKLQSTNNTDIPLLISTTQNFTATPSSYVTDVVVRDLHIKGTDTYSYQALAKARGILLRDTKRVIVTNNFIEKMSMIGVATESGYGEATLMHANIAYKNKYSAFNVNGRGPFSITSDNICYETGDPTAAALPVAIQNTGPNIIADNCVYGHITGFADYGGIMWGEGNYTGMGAINGCLVMHCRYGIKAIYHGPANISGNVLINNRTTSGIITIGGTTGGLTVAQSDSLINGNLCVNNYPYDIDTSANGTVISNNRCIYNAAPTNPGAVGDPDAVVVIRQEAAIHVYADSVSLIGNIITGTTRGIIISQASFLTMRVVTGNEITGTTAGSIGIESDITPGLIVATIPLFERTSNGGGGYRRTYHSSVKCTEGFWGEGDTWYRSPSIVGSSLGQTCVLVNAVATLTVQSAAADVTLDMNSVTGYTNAAGNIIGIELDNHQYHWTSVTLVAGLVVTIAAGIPAGRTAPIGTRVYFQQWAALANL